MDDIKILETCRVCGSPLTLVGSINEKGELWAVKRCLNCFSHPVEEVVQLMEVRVIERLAAAESMLNETYTDENETVWSRPTAHAYAHVCKACIKWQEKAAQAEADCRRLKDAISLMLANSNRYIQKGYNGPEVVGYFLKVDDADAMKHLLKSIDANPGTTLLAELEVTKLAFELACGDHADDCCPHEYGFVDWPECKECPHDGEFHTDTERDIDCYKRYYTELADNALAQAERGNEE